METQIRKSAAALGIFASGMAAGYAVTFFSKNTESWYPKVRQKIRGFNVPKFAPVIPDLSEESFTIEVEPIPGYYEHS